MRLAPKCHFVLRLLSGSLEIPTTMTLATLGPITLCADPRWKWGLKQGCSPHREISNDMSHVTCTQGNRGDSWLLVVGSQTANLIPDLFFSYNLCVKCPNGSCEPILDIYAPRAFQWYKEFFNSIGFDPYNCSLKIWKSTGTPTPKVGVHLGVWGFIPSHSLALPRAWNVTPGLPSWPTPSQALALVVNPRLGLWQFVGINKEERFERKVKWTKKTWSGKHKIKGSKEWEFLTRMWRAKDLVFCDNSKK
jgi:hypothetical protein